MAATLCTGGVIAYTKDERSAIIDNWIFDHVVPNWVSHGIDSQVGKVFGHAVLFWLYRSKDDAFPPQRRMQIMQA